MGNKFSKISRQRLNECDERLQRLMEHVLARVDISIVCGFRPKAEQDAAYEAGFSKLKYPKSKHNSWPSKAVDVIPFPAGYRASKAEWDGLVRIVKEEAELLGIDVICGHDWPRFRDSPHVELK